MAENDLRGLRIDKSGPSGAPVHRRRTARWVWAGLGLAALAAGITFFLNRPLIVETATVSLIYPSQTLTLLNASGYVVAQRKAAVAAQTTGRLAWLGVEEGSRVTTGQVLARLENREAQAVLEQARATLAAAQAARGESAAELIDARLNEQRLRELVRPGYISQAEADIGTARLSRAEAATAAAIANIEAAAAAVRVAQVAFDNTFIRAPFDAVVLTKNADLGDIVTPLGAAIGAKAAVVTIADLSSLQIEADVSEANLSRIRPGQPCEIVLDAIPDTRFPGELVTIVPTADRSKATVLVKVRFAKLDPRILPEMSARVALLERPVSPAETTPKTALPPAAVRGEGGRQVVFRIDGERARAVAVVLGPAIGDQVEVRSGISAGEKIVLRPLDRLRDGRRIAVAAP